MLGVIESAIGRSGGVQADEERSRIQADRVQRDQGARVIKWRVARMAAAAAVLLAAGIGVFYWMKTDTHKNPQPALVNTRTNLRPEEKIAALRTIRNASSRTRVYSLPDGSTVKLAAYSEVSFHQPFTDHRRDLFLQGEGVFNVRKDPSEPFAVHSKGITTTALGTVFSVDDKGSRFAIVHLFSGRVVVKKEPENGTNPLSGGTKGVFKEVYLLPGQELVLNKENYSAQVKAAEPRVRMTDTASIYPKSLQFTRQPLPDVLSLLEKEYKVTISYDSAGMKNMDFTGIFNHDKETLESFLGTLCDLNGLTLIKHKANSFSIREK
jgi:ferric-dicitrate binding protein FerR (iron transport regulator)